MQSSFVMSLRGLAKRLPSSGGINEAQRQRDESLWKMEREKLLMSRIHRAPNASVADALVSDLPLPPKSALVLGQPALLPELSAIRLTSSSAQHYYRGCPLSFFMYPTLYLRPFVNGKPHLPVWSSNSLAFDEAISCLQVLERRMWTSLFLVDWAHLPEEVDCVFIAVMLPYNFYNTVHDNYDASCLLEIVPADSIDDEHWQREKETWPDWDNQPGRASKAEALLFSPNKDFYHPDSVYSTYLCKEETGFVKQYLWGK